MVPRYLDFVKQMPKESPLTTAINTGMQTYGALQQLEEQRLRSKEEQMRVEALPGQLERQKTAEEQRVKEGEINLQYLPKEKEQGLQKGQAEIATNKLTQQHLQAMIQGAGLQNAMSAISLDTAKENVKNSELAKLYQASLNHSSDNPEDKKILDQQLAATKKRLAPLGVSVPNKIDDDLLRTGKQAYDAMQASDPFVQKMSLLRAAIDGKANVSAHKPTPFESQTQKNTAEYFNKDLSKTIDAADDMDRNVDDLLAQTSKHPGIYGTAIPSLPGVSYLMPDVPIASADAINLQLDKFGSTPGASRGSVGVLTTVGKSKISLTGDPHESIVHKAMQIKTGTEGLRQYRSFANSMMNEGIYNKSEIDEAWDNFAQTKPYLDKNGNYHPEAMSTWPEFFMQNPKKLPRGIQQKIQDSQKYGFQAAAQPMTQQNTPEQQQNAAVQNVIQSVFQDSNTITNNGMIPDYNPSSVISGE